MVPAPRVSAAVPSNSSSNLHNHLTRNYECPVSQYLYTNTKIMLLTTTLTIEDAMLTYNHVAYSHVAYNHVAYSHVD